MDWVIVFMKRQPSKIPTINKPLTENREVEMTRSEPSHCDLTCRSREPSETSVATVPLGSRDLQEPGA
jgi:hypothetical protein